MAGWGEIISGTAAAIHDRQNSANQRKLAKEKARQEKRIRKDDLAFERASRIAQATIDRTTGTNSSTLTTAGIFSGNTGMLVAAGVGILALLFFMKR